MSFKNGRQKIFIMKKMSNPPPPLMEQTKLPATIEKT